MDVFGGEMKARDALSSFLYSTTSSFCALRGCKDSAPPSSPSSPFALGTSSNHLLGPLGPLGKGRAVSFGRKAAGCHKGGSATASAWGWVVQWGQRSWAGPGAVRADGRASSQAGLQQTPFPARRATAALTSPQAHAKPDLRQKWLERKCPPCKLTPWLPNSFCSASPAPQVLGPHRKKWQGFSSKLSPLQLIALPTATTVTGKWKMWAWMLSGQGEKSSHFWTMVLNTRPLIYY